MIKKKMYLKKSTIFRIFLTIIEFIFLLLFCYSSYHIIKWFIDTNNNKKINDKINNNIKFSEEIDKETYVDFKKLKELNSDTIAYIYVPGTNIKYIVVKGNDNDYYLKHNFEKKLNIGGWIFADYRNRFDGTDKNIIIYGHNMKDGSMFETLKNVLDSNWYQNNNNHSIVLITENKEYNYKVFSTYSIKPEDYYIETNFSNDEEFIEFINNLKKRSNYNYPTDISNARSILTLSSCIGDGKKRVVLHAVLENYIEE